MQLKGSSVVITGASSGIGRASAREVARRGANVVLAARDEDALAEAAIACEGEGVTAIAVPTDVTNEEAVHALADEAVDALGGIDAWVNDAAVTAFGRFEDIPTEAWRRVIDTNLFGYVHGARAVLPVFRRQQRGVLVNVSSIAGVVSEPLVSPYVVSKHAIRALGMSLRQELQLQGLDDVHVCTIMPPTVDTPLYQHGANYSGRPVKAMPPVYPPEEIAKAIADAIEDPRPEIPIGAAGKAVYAQKRLAPTRTEPLLARQVDTKHFDKPVGLPPHDGNLYAPMGLDETHGGWAHMNAKSPFRRAAKGAAILGTVAGTVLAGWWAYRASGG